MTKETRDLLKRKYGFHWEIYDVIIGGKSMIDSRHGLGAFPMHSAEDAGRFTSSYGFDLDNPIQKAELLGNFHEAISFVRKYFLQPENPDGLNLEIPRKILEVQDLRDLIQIAGAPISASMTDQQFLIRNWACSLLKVVHTIAHMDKDIVFHYFSDVQKQILDRFYKVIHRDSEGQLYLGEKPDDPLRVNLVAFDTKPSKSRESVLLKLLHKPENVADDIFDRVGIRFVTHTPFDALRVIKYLKDAMIVLPANVKPSRSRNTLIDLEKFRTLHSEIMKKLESGELTTDSQLATELQAASEIQHTLEDGPNPHTSQHYRAIQFTSRQLIKLINPIFEDIKELKSIVKNQTTNDEISKIIERIDLKYLQREMRFFFPFEVQVMDKDSYEENEKGRSSHSEYRKAQIQTALKRVMGSFLDDNGL